MTCQSWEPQVPSAAVDGTWDSEQGQGWMPAGASMLSNWRWVRVSMASAASLPSRLMTEV
ncbi:MAG: hypothetical protein ABR912_12360 [Terracidiphilus sp.]